MEDSPLPLNKWLVAMWMIADCKNGIASHKVARHLEISQKSAWFLMHRIRLAMQRGSFEKWDSEVEADETFIGGKEKNKHQDKKQGKGRGTVGKAVVMSLLQRGEGDDPSQVQAQVVPNNRKDTVQPEVQARVELGGELYTDALASQTGIGADYTHQGIDHAVKYADGQLHNNGIENFWSLLDRCLDGTYVSVDPDHLCKYVDEEAIRFNERKNTLLGQFLKVACGVSGKRLTWDQLTSRPVCAPTRRGGGRRKPE